MQAIQIPQASSAQITNQRAREPSNQHTHPRTTQRDTSCQIGWLGQLLALNLVMKRRTAYVKGCLDMSRHCKPREAKRVKDLQAECKKLEQYQALERLNTVA